MDIRILLLAAEPGAVHVTHALRRNLNAQVEVAGDRQACMDALRREEFSILLLEDGLADAETSELLYEAAGSTLVLEVNLGIASTERITRQVRSALHRRRQDESKARAAAVRLLHNELNASLAGLLLESQLALRQAGPALAPSLRHLVELADSLRQQLRLEPDTPGSAEMTLTSGTEFARPR